MKKIFSIVAVMVMTIGIFSGINTEKVDASWEIICPPKPVLPIEQMKVGVKVSDPCEKPAPPILVPVKPKPPIIGKPIRKPIIVKPPIVLPIEPPIFKPYPPKYPICPTNKRVKYGFKLKSFNCTKPPINWEY